MESNAITLIGIFLTFIVSTASLLITIFYSRKTTFINTVTNSRIKYIQDFRRSVSNYLGLLRIYQSLKSDEKRSEKNIEILKSIEISKFQVLLFLNPENQTWDEYILIEIENLHNIIVTSPEINPNSDDLNKVIEKFVVSVQYLLKLEWEGAKLESKKGIINEREQLYLNRKNRKKLDVYLNKIK